MSKATSRRAILAGIATAPAIAAPALAFPAEPDPIFAAIDRHKVTFRAQLETSRIRCYTIDHPRAAGYDPVKVSAATEAESAAAREVCEETAEALVELQPTTMAGVLALIRYVEAFNDGAFFLEPWPDSTVQDWASAPWMWPEHCEDSIELWGFDVLANVRRALEAMGAAS